MAKDKASGETKEPVETVHRTIHSRLPLELLPACQSISRHCRDVMNSATWLTQTALRCFERASGSKDWTLKPEVKRPTKWKEALEAFDRAILDINASRGPEGKQLTPLGGGANANPLSTILDQTLFHKACRERVDGLDPDKKTAASRIPSILAKAAREQVLTNFSNWAKAVGAWAKSKEGGMPGMPGCVDRGKLPSFCFPLTETAQRFPGLGKFAMKLGEDKALDLSPAQKTAWNEFPLRRQVDDALAKWSKAMDLKDATPKSVRVKICRKRIELDIIAELPRTFPEGSFLTELKARHPEDWERRTKNPAAQEAWIRELIKGQAWQGALSPALPKTDLHAWISEHFSIVGADPGETNLVSLGFSSGAPMMIFCGRSWHRKAESFDLQIDELASALCLPEQRALQAKRQTLKDLGQDLPQEELARLRLLASQLWRNPGILALRERKKAYQRAELHRLASACAKAAFEQKAAVVVLSRSLGLKKSSGRGSKQERKAHNIPHALFAALLREKLERLGIAMIETEESFTSQASFVDGDPLGVHPQGKKQETAKAKKAAAKLASAKKESKKKAKDVELAGAPKEPQAGSFAKPALPEEQISQAGERQASESQELIVPSGAKRSSDRHWLVRGLPLKPAQPPRPNPHRRRRVHADGQAALNAIRKVCPAFSCSSKVNLGHGLWMLRGGRWTLWAPPKPRAGA